MTMKYTSDKTYYIRSNSVLLVSPGPHIDGSENQVVIQESLNESSEVVQAVPELHRVNALLKEYSMSRRRGMRRRKMRVYAR
jgi:hypothetical protein